MSVFLKNLNILFALSKKDEKEIFSELGFHPKTKYVWTKRDPHSNTTKKIADFFIETEGYPAHLLKEGRALFDDDFAERIKEILRNAEPPDNEKMPVLDNISPDEAQMIPRLRKIYGSTLSKTAIDRIISLLESLGIDSPLFTALQEFLWRAETEPFLQKSNNYKKT